jgi:hypothetical protein
MVGGVEDIVGRDKGGENGGNGDTLARGVVERRDEIRRSGRDHQHDVAVDTRFQQVAATTIVCAAQHTRRDVVGLLERNERRKDKLVDVVGVDGAVAETGVGSAGEQRLHGV